MGLGTIMIKIIKIMSEKFSVRMVMSRIELHSPADKQLASDLLARF